MMPKHEENLAILKDRQGREVALKGVKAHARLQGLLAEVAVEQSYKNPQDTNIEAVYTFPLPFGAVLLALEVEIAGKKLAGQVVEKKEAERRYEDAVTDGDSAVMLEESGPGLYTASLGNLMAGESAVIRYRYGLLLNWQGDRLRFLLPTTIAPRYGDAEATGLQPHQTPESSLTVEYPFELVVDVEGELATAAITSPSHPIAMERTDTGLRIRLDRKAFLDRDFVLTLASDKVQSSCVVVPDGGGHVALASLRIPPVPELERQPLALKLVIDCSGSMGGTSIAQARKAGLAILDQLRHGDSFNVTLFGSEFKHFFRKMVPASARYITEAWNQIDQMDADLGGTEMEKALEAVFSLKGEDTAGTLLLITDGEIQEHQKLVRRAEQSGQRVFVVGVGTSVAETFLRNLANATNGACELVAPQEGMSEFVLSQFHRMRQQRVGKLQLVWPVAPQWQSALPDSVFAGDTVHVFAGFGQVLSGQVQLSIEGGTQVNVPMTPLENKDVPRIAAARRLGDMSCTIADEARKNIERELAVKYQLLSPWTNFLVIAERADKAEELPELQKVPQMLAAGWGGSGAMPVCSSPTRTRKPRARMMVCEGVGLRTGTDSIDLFTAGRSSSRDSRANAMSDTGMDKYDIPAFLRKCADDSGAVSPSDLPGQAPRDRLGQLSAKLMRKLRTPSRSEKLRSFIESVDVPDTPVKFIALMEATLSADMRTPSLPLRILDLARSGLTVGIVRGLEAMIAKGYAESEVVAAFVYALTQSAVGESFGRSFRRAILKVWKQVSPAIDIDKTMQQALQDITQDAWNWRQSPIDQLIAGVPETV